MPTVKELIQKGDELFTKRGNLLAFWQTVAENFYPERADFTVQRYAGEEFAKNLMSSYPVIVRRELANAFSAMLRPRDRQWFSISINREERLDHAGKQWLEKATQIQRRAMYDRHTNFVRATKEGDSDYAAFGQCAISIEVDWEKTALLYRCWHLRDMAWCENHAGHLQEWHRKWEPTIDTLCKKFQKTVNSKVRERCSKEPYAKVKCRHIVMPADCYDGKFKTPYVSVYIDVDNETVLEEVGSWHPIYVVPRWQTVSGSQYAYSPATVAGLPDARLIQAMTLTLLEAGETAVAPPMIATKNAIRSDVALYAGGITWVDAEYDERLGEVLRPITQDKRGLPFGMEIAADIREMLNKAFFMDKISMPPSDNREMTAFEVSQRVQEYIRSALPLFEPMEIEYNGALCEHTFDILMRVGAFGPMDQIPPSIRGQDVEFKFESPLHRALDREKVSRWEEGRSLLLSAVEIDQSISNMVNVQVALRDALDGAGVPQAWVRDEETVAKLAEQQKMQATMMQAAMLAEQAGKGAAAVGQANQAFSQ